MKTTLLRKRIPQYGSVLLLGLWVALVAQTSFAQTIASVRLAPPWLSSGVVYELFPRQFSPEGNLNGVTARLDELKDLGVTIVWLMPIHPIGEKLRKGTYGSPYAARDYHAVNPDYGTKDDLKRLVSEAHKRDLKIILDVVLLHTAWDNVLVAHPEFYKHDARGKIVPPVREWTDVAGLNHENPELRKYLTTMLKDWVTETDVDGFRCDTASMVPTSFWEEARAALQQVKPDLLMLAEADKPELLTNAFDIDYAWPFMNTLKSVLEKGAPASELQRTWESDRKRYPEGALHLYMSDNHDEARAITRFGMRGALAASALMFTLDGVPLLYNGMEVGDATESGDQALFEQVPIFWHPKDRPPFRDIYRDLIKLRMAHPALRSRQVVWLKNPDPGSLVTFMRADDKEEFLVAINFSNRPISAKVDLKNSERFTLLKITGQKLSDDSTLPKLRLDGFEWRIYQRPAKLSKLVAGLAADKN
jgi:cyclomaltodextrinase / maltogenic alpha-amylase / neopullulanase